MSPTTTAALELVGIQCLAQGHFSRADASLWSHGLKGSVFKVDRESKRWKDMSGAYSPETVETPLFLTCSSSCCPSKEGRAYNGISDLCVHGGKGRERRIGVSWRERRVEVSCCINFSFRGKMCLPGEGTVCSGMADQESGFPPQCASSLCSLSPRNRTCTHT